MAPSFTVVGTLSKMTSMTLFETSSKSSFVKDRIISENILLAQEIWFLKTLDLDDHESTFWTIPSLWANFTTQKYYSRSHTVSKKYAPGDSHAWQNLRKIREKAEPHIHWIVNSGNSNIWWDNWSRKGPFALLFPNERKNPKILVKEYIHNGEWNIEKLSDTIPDDIVDHIKGINIGNQTSPYQAILDLSNNGLTKRKNRDAQQDVVATSMINQEKQIYSSRVKLTPGRSKASTLMQREVAIQIKQRGRIKDKRHGRQVEWETHYSRRYLDVVLLVIKHSLDYLKSTK
nr:uncharacterized protein LOC117280711 [Nicotiana tomentosiformis]